MNPKNNDARNELPNVGDNEAYSDVMSRSIALDMGNARTGQATESATPIRSDYLDTRGKFRPGNPGRPRKASSATGGGLDDLDDRVISREEVIQSLRRAVIRLSRRRDVSAGALTQLMGELEKIESSPQAPGNNLIVVTSNVPRPGRSALPVIEVDTRRSDADDASPSARPEVHQFPPVDASASEEDDDAYEVPDSCWRPLGHSESFSDAASGRRPVF